ncbi:MAG: hypothetical protein Q4B71_00400 [Cardiobacteriaceae bacterium]|nr:hypothetical protein [Cardiobacteriaceae bacterium]
MNLDQLFNSMMGLLLAVFWYWVRSIDKKQDEDKARMDKIEERTQSALAEIRHHYQRRDDAHKDQSALMEMLRDIKHQITRINDKLDQKADK